MAFRHVFMFMFLFTSTVVSGTLLPKIFDVVKYGAIADGKTDNAQAFMRAWNDACKYGGRSRVWIPRGTFLLGSVLFEGDCNGSMAFLIKGTLKARTDGPNLFADTWIGFRYVADLTVKGGGILDGQGPAAWAYNDCRNNSRCLPLPATLRFDFVRDSTVYNLRSVDSKSAHINLFACDNIHISKVRLRAPANSPNTDGIRIGSSTRVNISHSQISTGDDCISMVSGSQNIDIHDVTCGPGHGISIGSLGRSHEREYVTGITVRNCSFIGTDNGVRIKTWAPSRYSVASNIVFRDIVMENPRNPIVIDQKYCPSPHCDSKVGSSSAVQIKDVTFQNIWGISSSKVALKLQCSRAMPCRNIKLIDIVLVYSGPGRRATAQCSHVIGSSYGRLIPDGCL
ncbi:Pectin lyase-like superfamily protein [Striga hermonthica]|uniref:Pectin lyase-like superfamily protein n=1 Tax=Striga hermonthica TaxID=68872 RepID=A0A9N7R836_STRHE|nr:Pectin lyase-like superfamily protein [Striga hermonthica]